MKKYHFIVPHADDEVLGFGGTIAKLVEQGMDVSVTVLQSPNNPRSEKQLKDLLEAKNILGYKNLYNLYLSSITLSNDLHTLVHTIQDHFTLVQPHVVYTTHLSDNHQDHKALYRAVSIASRPVGPCKSIESVYAGEVISSNDQSFSAERIEFVPNVYEALNENTMTKKIKALKSYSTEFREFPHPRCSEVLRARAICRGSEVMVKYAEAFMLLRQKR